MSNETMSNETGFLRMIVGPMFSGKTTELLSIYEEYKDKQIVVINHSADNRYGDGMMISHDQIGVPCIISTDLSLWYDSDNEYHTLIHSAKYILINEAQFFPKIKERVLEMINAGKRVYLAGLDGDFRQNPFGRFLDLLPYCDEIVKRTANCQCGKKAIFSLRLTSEEAQVLIGHSNYNAVCRECYNINLCS